jgi:hypothetical protein
MPYLLEAEFDAELFASSSVTAPGSFPGSSDKLYDSPSVSRFPMAAAADVWSASAWSGLSRASTILPPPETGTPSGTKTTDQLVSLSPTLVEFVCEMGPQLSTTVSNKAMCVCCREECPIFLIPVCYFGQKMHTKNTYIHTHFIN